MTRGVRESGRSPVGLVDRQAPSLIGGTQTRATDARAPFFRSGSSPVQAPQATELASEFDGVTEVSSYPCATFLIAPLLLVGCASDSLESERTVFHNPYAPGRADKSGIGPQCETTARASDSTCLGVPLTRKGRGNAIGVPLGDTQDLSRAQRRLLRERAALLETLREKPTIPPPPPPTAEPPETP